MPGTFTGQDQAAWSVAANDQYVVLGGEFPTVNGDGQQGLVRFGRVVGGAERAEARPSPAARGSRRSVPTSDHLRPRQLEDGVRP